MVLSVVTLNYKKKDLTIACIDSLYEQYTAEFKSNQMEVLIVDNDSQDDSVSIMREEIKKKKFPNMHVIANDRNAGFGAGCNLGAKNAKGKYILFLNNDTVVKDKGLLAMAAYLDEHSDIAILGGQLRNFDGSLQASVGRFYNLWYAFLLLIGGQKYGLLDRSPKKIEQVDWVKGALLIIRREIFERLHGFDENIFMYTEDIELCYRVHLLGKKVFFYPDVMVLHKDHGSTSRTFAIVNIYKNLLYFYKKHRSVFEFYLLKLLMQTKAIILIILGKLLGKSYLVETYEKAMKEISN